MAGRVGRRRRVFKHPAQTIVAGFATVILLGTALLMLPVARSGPGGADLVTALFTSTSADLGRRRPGDHDVRVRRGAADLPAHGAAHPPERGGGDQGRQAHARILSQIGVHHVIRPEHDMGKRVAHLVRGRMLDYIEVDDDYAFVKTSPPSSLWGQRLADTGIRSRLGVTVVGVKRAGAEFTYATADSVLEEGDLVIVSGTSQAVERFSELS